MSSYIWLGGWNFAVQHIYKTWEKDLSYKLLTFRDDAEQQIITLRPWQ